MLRYVAFLVAVALHVTLAFDPNVHYQAHTAFFGDHPTATVNMYVGPSSRQLNLILELSRPAHLSHRNLTRDQISGDAFFYGHPTIYMVPDRSRKIHYSDTFHESAIPGAASIELYSEGVTRTLKCEMIGQYREMPTPTSSALSLPRPPGSLSYVSNGYHYASGLLRVDGALFLGPESMAWHNFDGFVLEHSQLNLISKGAPVEPIMTYITPLNIPCDIDLIRSETTINPETFEDFCSFSVYWPTTKRRYVLTFDFRTPFNYLPDEIYRHYFSKEGRKSDVDNYFAVEVGEARTPLVLPPVTDTETGYVRQRYTTALTPVITLGRDSLLFYRDVFGVKMNPTRELIISAPHPYHPEVSNSPTSHSAVTASGVFHVIFYIIALIAHYIFRGPTTNLLVRIGSYNSYDKYEMRLETIFQILTAAVLIGFIILSAVAPWRKHGPVFIIGSIGAGIHVLLLFIIITRDPVPLKMRLGISPYFPKRNRINERSIQMEPISERNDVHFPRFIPNSVRKRKPLLGLDTVHVPLMSDVQKDKGNIDPDDKKTPKVYDTESSRVFWVDDLPYVYYNLVTIDFIRSIVNVNSTIFIMMLFSLSYEFKFAFFASVMLTQLLAITNVFYMLQCVIIVRWFSHTKRYADTLSSSFTIFYGVVLMLYYGICGNILLFQQLQEANSFYQNTEVPVEIIVLINLGGILYAAFTTYNHIQTLITNFHRIESGAPKPKIHISALTSHVK